MSGLLNDPSTPAPATPSDGSDGGGDSGGFFSADLPNWIGKAGMTLAGGDPGLAHLSDEQKQGVGTRALLNMGLSMLMNSGPSYTPHSFGQILAAGMLDAQKVPEASEQAVVQNQMARAQLGLQAGKLGVESGGLGVQQYLAGLKGQELQIQLQKLKAAQDMVSGFGKLLGGGAVPGAGAANTAPTAPSKSAGDFVSTYSPLAQATANDTGLPLDYVLGQAGHETGWGKSAAASNNNFFGITDPKSGQLMKYDTPEAGFKAYADLMQSDRYKNVPRTGDPTLIADASADAGYNPNRRIPGQAPPPGGTYGDRVGAAAAQVRALLANQPGPGGPGGAPSSPGTAQATPPVQSDVGAIMAGMNQATPGAGTLVAGPGAPTGPTPGPAPPPGYDPTTGVRQRGSPDAPAGTGSTTPDMPQTSLMDLPPGIRQAYQLQLQAAGASGDPEKVSAVIQEMTKAATEYAKQERWHLLAPADAKTQLGPAYDPTVAYRSNQFGKVEPIGPGIAPINPADTPEGQWQQQLNTLATARLTKLGEQADKARDNLSQLDTVKALSDASGPANPIGQMEVGGKRVVDWLSNMQLGTPQQLSQWTAQQALNGALTKLSLDLRSGQGMGRLTNQELQYVQNSVPNPAQTPQTRNAMVAYLRDMYQRQVDYQTEVGNQLQNPGADGKRKTITQAEADAEKALGPTIKQVPTDQQFATSPAYQGINEEATKRGVPASTVWMETNVRPGTFYKKPTGALSIYGAQQ